MQRQTLLRTLVAAGAVAVLATGCGSMRPSEKIEIFEATLSGAQEVPPVNSAGSGQAELQWNRNSNVLSWKVTFTGLSGEVTGAHDLRLSTRTACQAGTNVVSERNGRNASPTWAMSPALAMSVATSPPTWMSAARNAAWAPTSPAATPAASV